MPVPVTEILLGVSQAVSLYTEIKRQHETGMLTDDELRDRYLSVQRTLAQTEANWVAMEERDAERGA